MRDRRREGPDMPDPDGRRAFGRRAFVRLGFAAGGLGMLAACAPAPPPAASAPTAAPAAPTAASAPAQPTQAAAQPAAAATQPAPASAPTAATAGQVTTLKLLRWDYEPPLVQENLHRFVQQNPNYKIHLQPNAC